MLRNNLMSKNKMKAQKLIHYIIQISKNNQVDKKSLKHQRKESNDDEYHLVT